MNSYGHRIFKTKYYVLDLDTKTFNITKRYDLLRQALAAIPHNMHATAIKGSELLEYPHVWYAAVPTAVSAKAAS